MILLGTYSISSADLSEFVRDSRRKKIRRLSLAVTGRWQTAVHQVTGGIRTYDLIQEAKLKHSSSRESSVEASDEVEKVDRAGKDGYAQLDA